MNHYKIFSLAAFIIAILASTLMAQDTSSLPYMNPKLSPEERVADLVSRMTLEEKASQLVNQARAVPRLKIPAYDWWSEALHGVVATGTVFPEPIGLAATFDVPLHSRHGGRNRHRRTSETQPTRTGRPPRPHGRSRFLVAQYQHLSRSALGTRPGNLWRGSFSDGPHGCCLCHRDAGRRSELLPCDRDGQTLCRPQRSGAHSAPSPSWSQQTRRGRHVPTCVSRGRRRGACGFGHVRIQRDQWRAGVRESNSCCSTLFAAHGTSRAM